MPQARGTLVVLEGVDRAGKTTQCHRLAENLRTKGHRVRELRFPDRTTPIGKMLDSYLKGQAGLDDHVAHLLFSANRWEVVDLIRREIAAGTTLIIDRYYYSGCVYSAAKNVPGLDLEWARWPDVGLPKPDVCIFLDLSADAATQRGGYGAEIYEKEHIQHRVRDLFQELSRNFDPGDFIFIDAGQAVDVVAISILASVLGRIDIVRQQNSDLGTVQPVRPSAES